VTRRGAVNGPAPSLNGEREQSLQRDDQLFTGKFPKLRVAEVPFRPHRIHKRRCSRKAKSIGWGGGTDQTSIYPYG